MLLRAHRIILLIVLCLWLPASGCKPPQPRSTDPTAPDHPDAIFKEIMDYRYATRLAYNSRRFDELEQNADQTRSSKAKFGNGGWRIVQFYDALGCKASEPESMWQLHDTIHKEWIAAKPDSITACVARIVFLVEYAWHARGTGYAGSVTPEGWHLFGERLKEARQALIDSRRQGVTCPEWWLSGMRIGLGEGWPKKDYERFYEQAKALEPTFWGFDTLRSRYLSLKWEGQPGEWEEAAETASLTPNGLGLEIYSRCVLEQINNYKNVFTETRATWAKAKQGFELMLQRYPASLEVVSAYCRVACVEGDRATAKRLFDRIGINGYSDIWVSRDYWQRCWTWAEGAR